MIAGELGHIHAEQQPTFLNRGISGNRVSDLYARWNEDAISLKPDVISILIGVNDAWRIVSEEPSGATDRFERAYLHLLTETREVMPEVKLVLCEPFILKTGATAARWEQWTELIAGYRKTLRELAERFDAVYVPLQDVFDAAEQRREAAYWLWDGVHPTAAGHHLIAQRWLEVVNKSGILD
ncbi:GDSL-like Lipase/Acylhydrolase [compost metagenome]